MLEIYHNIKNLIFNSNYSSYILLGFLIVLFSRGFPLFNGAYVLIPLFLIIFLLFSFEDLVKKNFKIVIVFISLFFLWASISSLWSEFPIFTLKRSLYFLLVSLGSFSVGYQLSKKNSNIILNSFLALNIFITTISMFSLIANTPENSWSGGHGLGFLGFNNHQNKLGQYIYLSVAPLILFFRNPKLKKTAKYLVSFLLIVNLALIALSVSRAAILALFISWFLYYLIRYSVIKSIVFSLIFIGIILGTVFVTSNYFNKSEVTIIKNEQYLGQRRSATIKYSWESALHGNLLGLGYGISDNRFLDPQLGYYDSTREGEIYRREKTISVLALVEEVGIIGLILFLIILFYPIKLIWDRISLQKYIFSFNQVSRIQYPESNFLLFTFTFLLSLNIYAQIESWWIGLGSAVLPVYFVFVGASLKAKLN